MQNSVNSISVDETALRSRIEELKQLQQGWLDGSGEPLDSDQLEWLVECLVKHFHGPGLFPYLFPTPEGKVLLEWMIADCSVTLEIHLNNRHASWHSLNLLSNEVDESYYEIDHANAWKDIASRVKKLRRSE